MSEADVATAVMAHLVREGWECWPEVELPSGRADIVAVRGFPFMPQRRCVHIVETKTTWSIDLLEQAVARRAHAHYVSIAAPTRLGGFYERLCRDFGIGVIRVYKFGAEYHVSDTEHSYQNHGPRLQRHKSRGRHYGPQHCLESLHDDQKRYTPGSTAASGYSTPWRRTMDMAARFVTEHPGCTVKDLLSGVKHHYASASGARQGFLTWLEKRPDVVVRKVQGAMRFYPPGHPETPALALETA